jgi:DNA-directed RNA polymerase subunit RPC12/RpoP
MKKLRQANCPYCGEKVGFLRSWVIKTQGEYQCPKCGGYSNIELDPAAYLFAVLAVVLSGLIYLADMIIQKGVGLFVIALILLPFLMFYLLSVFLIRLRKLAVRKKQPVGRKAPESTGRQNNSKNSNIEHTIIAESFEAF